MKEQIARSVFWIVWSRGGIQFLSFVSTIMVARLLDPGDYGLMALAGVWTGIIALIAEMGLSAAIVQFRELEAGDLNACFWLTLGLSGAGYLVLYIAAPSISTWFASPKLTGVLRVSSIALPLIAVRVIPDGLLRKQLALDKISQAEIIATLLGIPVVLGLAWAGAGVWALVAGALIGPLVQSLVIFWFVRWWPGLQIDGRHFREVVGYSLTTLGTRLCWSVYQQADGFVVGKVSGDVALGLYSMAKQIATLPVSKMTAVVNQLAFPVMAQLQAHSSAMSACFLREIGLIASLTFPLCMGMMVLADDFVLVVLTDKWLSAVPILQVFCLFAVIRCVDVLLPPILMARYRTGSLFGYTLFLMCIMPPSCWLGAIWFGPVGAAATWVGVYPIIMMSWLARATLAELGVSWRLMWQQFRLPMVATGVMIVTMFTSKWVLSGWVDEQVIARLAFTSLTGAAVYALCLVRYGGPILEDVKEVVGWLFLRKRPPDESHRVTTV